MKKVFAMLVAVAAIALTGCGEATPKKQFDGSKGEVKLLTLDPGHFHAALV